MFCHASFYEIGDVDTDVALSADYRQAKTLNNRNNTDKLISKSIVICNFEKRGCSRNLSLNGFYDVSFLAIRVALPRTKQTGVHLDKSTFPTFLTNST